MFCTTRKIVLPFTENMSDKYIEAIWIHVNFPSATALFSLIYRPPDDYAFFDRFQKQLENAWHRSPNI